MPEQSLLTGALEESNSAYAIAKIAGLKLCDALYQQHGADYRAVMPTNLYGSNDNFHPENSHVVPALMRRIHEAHLNSQPCVVVWGSGKPLREFLYVDHMAAACIFVMGLSDEQYRSAAPSPFSFLNVGTGRECTIAERAFSIKKVIGYNGEIEFDASKPDGTPRKLLDVSRLKVLGWQAEIDLLEGLERTYEWFKQSSVLSSYRATQIEPPKKEQLRVKIRPVILAGGSGTRLWPLSRGMYPKQFLPLAHDSQTMLQQTLDRLKHRTDCCAPIIVCNEEHRFLVAEQLKQNGNEDALILLEPEGRNTAPAIAIAALLAQHLNKDLGEQQALLVMPADHVIQNTEGFNAAVDCGLPAVASSRLNTFGIQALTPETGYGYIQRGEASEFLGVSYVTAFHEKPELELAETYLATGQYLWNGGIFMFSAHQYMSELDQYSPLVVEQCLAAFSEVSFDHDFVRVGGAAFSASPRVSVDYAVMEKASDVCVIPLDVGWNDIGSWSALWDVSEKDCDGNATRGDAIVRSSTNCHIIAETKVVAVLGVKDLVVVETADAVLVASKEQVQDVKHIVASLSHQDRSQVRHHRKVYRPWGWYDSIDVGESFQAKRIHVKPGAKLSVQKHRHRAEQWVVVKGSAEMLNGDDTFLLDANESTYIPIGRVHSLRNPSQTEPLETVEVQTGDYLGEDDIVRLDDQYGRK